MNRLIAWMDAKAWPWVLVAIAFGLTIGPFTRLFVAFLLTIGEFVS